MNKIINSPENMVKEMLEGYLLINPDLYKQVPLTNGLVKKHNNEEKVSIVIGGGSGNEPWILGYVGNGLADGASLGHVYTAPPARSILNVTHSVPNKNGVIYICTNHAGDVLNFELVSELAQIDGIDTSCVFVTDDMSTSPSDNKEERRGVAGIALIIKIAGAACEAMLSKDEVIRIAKKANENLSTLSVTTSAGYFPANGKPMFTMPEGEIEYGMGFNGEPGILHTKLTSADEIAETLINNLIDDLKINNKDEVAVMINSFGFTSQLELCILARRIKQVLDDKHIKVHDIFIDNLFCPQGTGGCSISVLKLDNELKQLYDMPAYSPFFRKIKNEVTANEK